MGLAVGCHDSPGGGGDRFHSDAILQHVSSAVALAAAIAGAVRMGVAIPQL